MKHTGERIMDEILLFSIFKEIKSFKKSRQLNSDLQSQRYSSSLSDGFLIQVDFPGSRIPKQSLKYNS